MSVHYYPLINKIMASLKIRDSLFKSESDTTESLFLKPFITIAREPGSGGAPIAQAVADKLGFTFVSEQIVEEIASSTKQRKEAIKAIDEKNRTRIEDMVHSLFNAEYVDDVKYVTELAKVILTYALKGNVVILGRGANFITPFAKGLHVNVTAPYQVRVQRAMDFEGLREPQAKAIIAKVEQERKLFIKQYLRKDITKANSYDLTLNTTYFRVNEATDVIVEAFYRKFSRSVRYGSMLKRA
jgi:cytidylate kinase